MDAYYNRGNAYVKLKQPIKAIQDFDKVIEIDPGYAMAYNNRAAMYIMLQRVSQGCADLRKGCDLGVGGPLGQIKNMGVCL